MKYTEENPKIVKFFTDPEEISFTGVVKDEDGDMAYYKDGFFHREDGPALLINKSHMEWYNNGKLHRYDGPAIVDEHGSKHWYIHGKVHREDGPAIEYSNGATLWYYNGEYYGYDNDFTNESWTKKWRFEIFK